MNYDINVTKEEFDHIIMLLMFHSFGIENHIKELQPGAAYSEESAKWISDYRKSIDFDRNLVEKMRYQREKQIYIGGDKDEM